MEVLIVSESLTLRRAVQNALNRAGVAGVRVATTVFDAINLLDESLPKVVLFADDRGAKEVGTFASTLRRIERYRSLPVLFVTPECTYDDMFLALEFGVTDIVAAPFDEDLLVQKVNKYLVST